MATGSATVYLNPPLHWARVELRYKSYDYDELAGFGYTVNGVFTFSGTFYTTYDVYQIRFPAQEVDGIWYDEARTSDFVGFNQDREFTLLITGGPQEGEASIIEINLPAELEAGEWITGTVKAQNIGTVEDDLRILITTEWNAKKYQGNASVPVGSVLTITISTELIAMPEIDAVIKVEGQHLENGVWVTDDIKTH